ncbi:ABC transporter substrate-binding protein [Microbacterium sp.]|uniref:ABC transporter substrate-binding protein n=1 Tax=Microbacterium sp. TaxID=51671 RepID=UPI003A8C2FCC
MHTRSPLSRARAGLAAVVVSAVAVVGLAGCSGNAQPAATDEAMAPLAEGSFQLGWFPNVESMAPIVAAVDGYFAEEGVEVTILPGGPEVTIDAQIVSGNALMGNMSSEGLANSIAAGAPLVAVGATYQTSSSAIVTLADSGITEPKDLEGKRFGMSQTDARVYTPFFELTGVDETKVDEVQTGSDPAALVSGEVDAMSGTLPNQPVAIEAQGLKTNVIRLADYGYNRWSNLLVVHKDSLEDPDKRAVIEGMLAAVTRGLETAVADPAAAAQIVYDEYGEQLGLDLDQQKAAAQIWAELATDGTQAQGVMRVTEEGVASQQAFFDTIGLDIDASEMFDLSVQGQ